MARTRKSTPKRQRKCAPKRHTKSTPKRRTKSTSKRWSKKTIPRRPNKTAFANVVRKFSRLRTPLHVEAMKLANNNFVRQFCQNVNQLRHARLPPHMEKKLQQSSTKLRKLVSRKTSLKSKRDMLAQRGGFLGFLLPVLLKTVLGKVL